LNGEAIDQAADLVRAVVRECADAGIRLHRVTVDPELFSWLTAPGSPALPGLISVTTAARPQTAERTEEAIKGARGKRFMYRQPRVRICNLR
jgi:hypothetical protein